MWPSSESLLRAGNRRGFYLASKNRSCASASLGRSQRSVTRPWLSKPKTWTSSTSRVAPSGRLAVSCSTTGLVLRRRRHGTGAEVRGKAIDLLLLVANRRQVVDRLQGPGLAQLAL